MADNFRICVGTIGTGAWVSSDGGESWRQVRTGLWSESRVFGFAVHPKEPRTVLAGADDGVYCSEDGGEHFERLDSPMNQLHVWKVAFDPANPEIIFAGTRPAALYRSTDGGRHWVKLRADGRRMPECAGSARHGADGRSDRPSRRVGGCRGRRGAVQSRRRGKLDACVGRAERSRHS